MSRSRSIRIVFIRDERIEQFGEAVVGLDLNRVRVELQTHGLDEAARHTFPIDVRIRGDVRVVVSGGAIDLGEDRHRREARAGAMQAMNEVRHLFAECGRSRRLAMSAGQHGQLRRAHG